MSSRTRTRSQGRGQVRRWGRVRRGNGDGGGDGRPNARQNGDGRGDTNEGSSTNGNGEVNKGGFRRTEMGAGRGAVTIIEKRGEERVNPGTYERWKTLSDVYRKTRERGRHRRGNSSHGRTIGRLSETTASCGRTELSDGRPGTGPGRLTGGRRRARNLGRQHKSCCCRRHVWRTGETWWVEGGKSLDKKSGVVVVQ